MTYVKRVVVCEAFAEPCEHYRILANGESRLEHTRRPSVMLKGDAIDLQGGMAAAKKRAETAPGLFDDALFEEEPNALINELRDEVCGWRLSGYPGTARVTRRLLEWWFERPDERHATHQRFFFCQQEAVETVIYLYEVRRQFRFTANGGVGDLLRYALKLATGTGKTVVMGMLIAWSTLHKEKVANSSLASSFLVLVPNLTVRARVSGDPRGDGIVPGGIEDLYHVMDIVPPEYAEDFHPKVLVQNWQAIPLESKRDDWIPDSALGGQRFVPYSVQRAMERRTRRDPRVPIRKLLKGMGDVLILNDEAHHAYGAKKVKAGADPEYVVWKKVIQAVSEVARVPLVLDLSATPWYGSGADATDGKLFEWVVSDFSVYDAFESGLVKVVRLPEGDDPGALFLDLYDRVKEAKTKDEFLSAAGSALETLYAGWKADFQDWSQKFDMFKDSQPVMLVIAPDGKRASWLYEYLTDDPSFELLHNPDPDEPVKNVTIRVDSKVFEAEKGREAMLREMVSTVGKQGAAGENVRAIVAVDMLSEGWDVKSVSHIIGFRRFGSPLLTEQVIGRGLRRTEYETLYTPLEQRSDDAYETVDALGIPFIGMPVQRTKKRVRSSDPGHTPIPIEPEAKKKQFRVVVPNVRSWAVGITKPLHEVISVASLRELQIDPTKTPSEVTFKPPVGEGGERTTSLDEYRVTMPVTAIAMELAAELLRRTSNDDGPIPGIGPTFDELLEVTRTYIDQRVVVPLESDLRDVWIPVYRQQVLDTLETAIRGSGVEGVDAIPMLDRDKPHLDTGGMSTFRWVAERAVGKKTHLSAVACQFGFEPKFADWLDAAADVDRYVKNEKFDFSVTYYEGGRPRQYYPDFIVVTGHGEDERWWVVETKGEIWSNTDLKRQAAERWCRMMTSAGEGPWEYVFVHQPKFERAVKRGAETFSVLLDELADRAPTVPNLTLISDEEAPEGERFRSLLPVYSLEAAAGYFGEGHDVEREGWMRVDSSVTNDMFVARVVGHSMEPMIPDGSLCVFKARPAGSRAGKVVLVQAHDISDPETGGSYTVKTYSSEKVIDDETGDLVNVQVTLSPKNPDFTPIIVTPDYEADVAVVAEFLSVLG